MSADSPRRLSRKGSAGNVVLPQPVSDPSIIDSVAGFIHEVIPQAYSSVLPGDSRESIAWARFEQADYNDPILYPDTGDDCDSTAPLLLVLGYANGVQVWNIPASGEAVEVLSWNQRVVRTLRFLPAPECLRSSLNSDPFSHKRPLIALVDNAGPTPHFCSVSFISLHGGDQVKSIKFKNPICDVLANRRSIVITFLERIAVFDALTLEDRLIVTTCYPSPGICQNPVSLGSRWLAYADKRLVSWWRSIGGCDGDGSQSYTATMLHAAKSLGKGLRGLSGSVASSLSGTGVPSNSIVNGAETTTPGVVTILDTEGNMNSSSNAGSLGENIVAHFVAHSDPIVALSFDPSGTLLLTVDKRGHRFHLFRIQPHVSGSSLCEIHQLYTLYRGDTTARIQDITFSSDSRWVAVSSLRGTTHVFPITPYGGSIGVRTHTTPHVVNKLSRFHRSAGLSDEGGRNSPVAHDGPPLTPPLPLRSLPTPHALTVQPLAQLRHQAAPPSSEDAMLRLAAIFAPPRACLPGLSNVQPPLKSTRRALDSIYIMSGHGNLIQYDLEPRHITGLSKDRISDDTAIELIVDPKAEWIVMSPPLFNPIQPPLNSSNPLLSTTCSSIDTSRHTNCISGKLSQNQDEHWLSQVEIVTHAGPHRRLWMGPQFTFKTYNLSSSDLDKDSVEVGTIPVQSNPINVPMRPPLLIESGSTSSLEQSPHLTEVYQNEFEFSLDHGESRLREDLADAMQESTTMAGTRSVESMGGAGSTQKHPTVIERRVNPLGTIIMIEQKPHPERDPSLHHNPNAVGEHLIVVAAESLSSSSARTAAQADRMSSKKKDLNNTQVPDTRKKCLTNNNNNNFSSSNESKDISVSKNCLEREIIDPNEKIMSKSNNKERRKNAKNDRVKSNKSTDSSNSKSDSIIDPKNVEFEPLVIEELPITNDGSPESSIVNVSDSPVSNVESSKVSKRRSRNLKKHDPDMIEESIKSTEEKSSITISVCVEQQPKVTKKDSLNYSHSEKHSLAENFEDNICNSTIEITNPQPNIVGTEEKFLKSSDEISKILETDSEVQNLIDDNADKHQSPVFDFANKPEEIAQSHSEVIKDREYPTLSSTIKTKRKCRTLGKKITKVPEDKPVSKPAELGKKVDDIDLLDCQQPNDHNLMDFPDLLLSNVKLFDSENKNQRDFREETVSIAQVVLKSIEKDNLNNDSEIIVKTEETELITLVSKSANDETTDKDSSDDCLSASSKCDSKGSNHKKRKPSRKQKENSPEALSDSDTNIGDPASTSVSKNSIEIADSLSILTCNLVTNEPPIDNEPKKLSWSQITSLGKKNANSNYKKDTFQESKQGFEESSQDLEEGKQDSEEIIQPEIISWNNVKCLEKENATKTNSTEDRGSVYESCSESVEESENQCQGHIEVADEAEEDKNCVNPVANDEAAYQLCPVYSSEKESGDSAEKESADSGEKDAPQLSKKSRKQRKKRR